MFDDIWYIVGDVRVTFSDDRLLFISLEKCLTDAWFTFSDGRDFFYDAWITFDNIRIISFLTPRSFSNVLGSVEAIL